MVDAAACMKRSGFPGYAVTLPPITEEMVQGFSIPVGWLPPPVSLTGPADVNFLRRFDELLARSERESNNVDPRFDEPRFQEAQTRCENEAPFESTIDWSPVEKLAAEMDSISSSSMKDPEFEKLVNAYATCVKASGESFSHPDEIQDAYSRGEITREVLDRQISVDDRCRAPLYQKFIALSADDWEGFLQSRGDELNRIAVDWQEITASSGLS